MMNDANKKLIPELISGYSRSGKENIDRIKTGLYEAVYEFHVDGRDNDCVRFPETQFYITFLYISKPGQLVTDAYAPERLENI